MVYDFFRELDEQVAAKRDKRIAEEASLNRELSFSRGILGNIRSAAAGYFQELNARGFQVNASTADNSYSVTLSKLAERAKFTISLDLRSASLSTSADIAQDEVNGELPYEAKDAHEEFHRRFQRFIRDFVISTS